MIAVAFFNQDYLMQREVMSALPRALGVRLVAITLPSLPTQEQASKTCDALRQQGCRILFTVNDWGMDLEGAIACFCEANDVLHVNWCADDPFFYEIFHGVPLRQRKNRLDFVTDRGYVEAMADRGLNAHFLPLATDPEIFFPAARQEPFERTACFVGNSYRMQIDGFTKGNEEFMEGLVPFVTSLLSEYKKNPSLDLDQRISAKVNERPLPASLSPQKAVFILKHVVSYFYRKRLIVSLARAYSDFMVYGDEYWALALPVEKVSTAVGYYVNLCETYHRTKVNIDVNRVVIREGLTQRVFDCLASGSFVVTSAKSVLPEFFELRPGKEEVVVFESERHLRELIDFYASHDSERSAIVDRGRKRVLAEHTYNHRLTTVFKVLSSEMG
jgi:spore maturation protein CgeB